MPPTFSEESFQLYQTYQVEIHKEQRALVTRDGFQRFLCDSPLTNRPSNCTILGSPLKLGTFHIHYRIHGKLMAISVVDILPNCISSVYLIQYTFMVRVPSHISSLVILNIQTCLGAPSLPCQKLALFARLPKTCMNYDIITWDIT